MNRFFAVLIVTMLFGVFFTAEEVGNKPVKLAEHGVGHMHAFDEHGVGH